jgi:4-amino-4-deoxy-L-arabinose transferase-like glycosyltransferase
VAFAGLSLAYWINFRAPALGMYYDDAVYVVMAKALAEGKGYRILSLPQAIAQTKYPPLFPMLLAAVWKLYPHFPQNIRLLKLVPLISECLWLWLSFLYIRARSASSSLAWAIVLLTAAAPWTVFSAAVPLSEMTFALFCTATLLTLHRLEAKKGSDPTKAVLAGVLAAAATLTRVAGFPLAIAGGAILLCRRKVRAAVLLLAVFAGAMLPWLLWIHAHKTLPNSTYNFYSQANYFANWNLVRNYGWPQKQLVFNRNVLYALLTPAELLGAEPLRFRSIVVMLVIGCFVVLGYLKDLHTKIDSLNVFLLLYTGTVLLWVFFPTRFYLPMLPFLLLYGYSGFKSFLSHLFLLKPQSPVSRWICLAAVIPLVTTNLYLELLNTRRTGVPGSAKWEDWNSFVPAFDWITRNTPSDCVIMSTVDPTVYLYTGRKAVLGLSVDPVQLFYARDKSFPLGTPTQMAEQMLSNKVSYILNIRGAAAGFYMGTFLDQFIDGLASRHPNAIRLVAVGSDPHVRIYKVDQAGLAGAFAKPPVE